MSDESPTVSPQAQIMVNLAKESLARKFKISEDKIHLFSVEPMVWPDAGLGCPQAGIVYAEVPVGAADEHLGIEVVGRLLSGSVELAPPSAGEVTVEVHLNQFDVQVLP